MSDHPADAAAERKAALRAASRARRAFSATFSPFVKALQECMTAYLKARTEGVERADAVKGIELTLRDVWPKATTKFPPKCEFCDDVGCVEHVCRPYARCQRERCSTRGEEWQHTYVLPCECSLGARFRFRTEPDNEMAAVGKSKPKRGFTKL